MTPAPQSKTTARLLGSACALAMCISPVGLTLDRAGLHLGTSYVFAKDGGSDGGHGGSGSGGGDHDGGGHDGGGHDGGGGGDSGGDGGGNSGRGGNDDDGADDNGGRHGAEHVGRTGAKVEVSGRGIEVVHASGIKEEIENGRFEMKDASGRTIVERPATAADRARLAALAR